jgi:uncharacterized protein YeaO (DUF488 family)
MELKIKRVYEQPVKGDRKRILVDRLWPRGLTKEKASVDLWLRDIAPSTKLRQWFGHDPKKWKEFKKRYREELKSNKEQISILDRELKKGMVTLVYVQMMSNTMKRLFLNNGLTATQASNKMRLD